MVKKAIDNETCPIELIRQPEVKACICSEYSDAFYNGLLKCNHFYTDFELKDDYYSATMKGRDSSYEAEIGYSPEMHSAWIILYRNNARLNKDGEIDLGNWTVKYFKDEFGEEIKTQPYAEIKFDREDKSEYSDEELVIQLSTMTFGARFGIEQSVGHFYPHNVALKIRTDRKTYDIPVRVGADGLVYIASTGLSPFLDALSSREAGTIRIAVVDTDDSGNYSSQVFTVFTPTNIDGALETVAIDVD